MKLKFSQSSSNSPDLLSSKNKVNLTIRQWVSNKLKKPLQMQHNEQFSLISKEKKSPAQTTSLQTNLRRQHRTNKDGTQIVNLPKLPFGQHENYNSEEDFSKSHFVMKRDDLTPRRRKNLDELSHKFRLLERREQKKYRNLSQVILSSGEDKDVLSTHSGNLIVSRQLVALQAYEAQQAIYFGRKMIQTNREVERDQVLMNELKKRIKSLHSSVNLDQSSTRLYQSLSRNTQNQTLTSKFEKRFRELLKKSAEGMEWAKKAKQATAQTTSAYQ